MTRIYGIPNCSTVKNARTWLAEHNIAAEFTDFKNKRPMPNCCKAGWHKCRWPP